MKYYLIAGEASGDLHGSNLIKEIKLKDPTAEIRAWGGDKMQHAGAFLVKHYTTLAFMGFAEVVLNLPTILKNLRFCKKDVAVYKPDVLVFIDYPGFNLKIAEWAKPLGYKTIWYISPQLWAWKEKRIHSIKKCIHKMLCILPFEKAFYKKWNYEAEYVGHPLIEVINNFKINFVNQLYFANKLPIIAILPGSRKQEILKKLPVMLSVASRFPQYQFVVAKAPGQEDSFYEKILAPYPQVMAVADATYNLLQLSTAAMVTSGTATLETALFGVPQVVCYKGNPLSYQIAKRVIKIKYISLVNLIMDEPIVKELIQHQMNADNLYIELNKLLTNKTYKTQMEQSYQALWQTLSVGGNASSKAAEIITSLAMG